MSWYRFEEQDGFREEMHWFGRVRIPGSWMLILSMPLIFGLPVLVVWLVSRVLP